MEITEAPVIMGRHNECFYVRGVDRDGNVTYTSEYGSEQNWIAYALIKRPEDWVVAGHLEMITSRY